MKFAFSTLCCPEWDLRTIIDRAVEYGYSGLEIRSLNGALGTDLFAKPELCDDPARIAATFKDAGLEIVCLSSSASYFYKRSSDLDYVNQEARGFVQLASMLHCPVVRVFFSEKPPGWTREKTMEKTAQQLRKLGEFAIDQGVSIGVENAGQFVQAADFWTLIEMTGHPAVGVIWNPVNAMIQREYPNVSIPCLNHRLKLVHLKDAQFVGQPGDPHGHAFCQMGEGDVDCKQLLTTLQGVGYEGYVSVEWDKFIYPMLAEPEEVLPATAATIQKYMSLRAWPSIGTQRGDFVKPKPVKAKKKAAPAPKNASDTPAAPSAEQSDSAAT